MKDIFLLARQLDNQIPIIIEGEKDEKTGVFGIKGKNVIFSELVTPKSGFVEGLGMIEIIKVGDKRMDIFEDYQKLVNIRTGDLRELANDIERKSREEFKKVQKEMVENYASPAKQEVKEIKVKKVKLKDEPGI